MHRVDKETARLRDVRAAAIRDEEINYWLNRWFGVRDMAALLKEDHAPTFYMADQTMSRKEMISEVVAEYNRLQARAGSSKRAIVK